MLQKSFPQKPGAQTKPISQVSLMGSCGGEESLFAASGSNDQDGHHAKLW